MDIIQLISAAGIGGIIGSLLTTVIQAWLANRQLLSSRSFQEKKEAYVGLLEAYRAAANKTEKAAMDFAYWQMRCELVASPAIREAIQSIVETNDMPHERSIAHEKLKSALRQDLKLASSD